MFCLLLARPLAEAVAEAKGVETTVQRQAAHHRHVRPVTGLQPFAVAPFILTPIPASDFEDMLYTSPVEKNGTGF